MATKIPYDRGSGLLRVVRSDSSYDEAYCTSIELNIILQDSEVRVFEVKSFGYTILRVDEDLIIDLAAFTDYATVQDAYDDVFAVLTAMLAAIGGGGSGDVTTSGTVLDEEIVIYDGTTGDSIKSSGYTIAQLLALIFDGAIIVNAATTAALAGSPVYANGAAGVGATLTKGSNGAFPSQDGVASVVGNVYLVKNQATQTQNGVYELTTLGTAGTPWVLTRTTDSDQPAELNAQIVIVGAGTVNKRRLYSQTTPTPTIGTNNIVYAQTPAPNMSEYVKRDGTVDFIAAETWDAGGTDTVTVSPSAITVTDGTDTSYIDKVNIVITDGADSVTLAKDSISAADAANTAFMSKSSIAVNSIGSGANASINANGIILSNGVQQSNIRFIKKTLSSAEIISLLSTPIVLITSPGGGTFINLISCTARLVYNSAAFDNLAIYAITASATKDTYMLRTSDTFLNNVGGKVEKMFDMRVTNQSSLMYEAEDVMLISEADSVAAGDSSVELFAIYEIITF